MTCAFSPSSYPLLIFLTVIKLCFSHSKLNNNLKNTTTTSIAAPPPPSTPPLIMSNSDFDMADLRSNLPQKRGLSRHYSGKSQSFTCMADVHSIEDLKKQENPEAKKRKKYAHGHHRIGKPSMGNPPALPCRRVSSVTHCPALFIGA